MQSAAKHLASSVERLIYGCLRDASSLLDAQNALHDGLIARLVGCLTILMEQRSGLTLGHE
jgi:hypothetical protein